MLESQSIFIDNVNMKLKLVFVWIWAAMVMVGAGAPAAEKEGAKRIVIFRLNSSLKDPEWAWLPIAWTDRLEKALTERKHIQPVYRGRIRRKVVPMAIPTDRLDDPAAVAETVRKHQADLGVVGRIVPGEDTGTVVVSAWTVDSAGNASPKAKVSCKANMGLVNMSYLMFDARDVYADMVETLADLP